MSSLHEMKEGDEIELEIKETSKKGDGIARAHGCIIFVKDARAGEKVRVRITKAGARHAHAEIIKRF